MDLCHYIQVEMGQYLDHICIVLIDLSASVVDG